MLTVAVGRTLASRGDLPPFAVPLIRQNLQPQELRAVVQGINTLAFALIGATNFQVSGGRNPGWEACLLVVLVTSGAGAALA